MLYFGSRNKGQRGSCPRTRMRQVSKIEDIAEMMNYNIMTTPAVVVDGIVRIKGHVPSADEVKKVLGI